MIAAADVWSDMSRSSPRVGAVSYLNSKPLVEGLSDAFGDGLVLDYPSRLADALAADEVDVALIPSVEVLRSRGSYAIVSDACVAARGPVRSVKAYFRVPPGDVRTLALDEGSRTSATLLRLMLHHRYGVSPKISTLPLEVRGQRSEVRDQKSEVRDRSGPNTSDLRPLTSDLRETADAFLLIGDRAMRPAAGEFVAEWDLGQEWNRWTGLPFVFAVWAGRRGCIPPGLEDLLSSVRNRGLSHVDSIARREAARLDLGYDLVHEYLTKNLHFTLGSAELNGLRLFTSLASDAGLVPGGTDFVFHDGNDDSNERRVPETRPPVANRQKHLVGAR